MASHCSISIGIIPTPAPLIPHGSRFWMKSNSGILIFSRCKTVTARSGPMRRVAGTVDDRYINPTKRSGTAAVFATLQGLVGQCYAQTEPEYAKRCLEAGIRAWRAFPEAPNSTQDLAWWAMAACELY